jgi:hypothetical protein
MGLTTEGTTQPPPKRRIMMNDNTHPESAIPVGSDDESDPQGQQPLPVTEDEDRDTEGHFVRW